MTVPSSPEDSPFHSPRSAMRRQFWWLIATGALTAALTSAMMLGKWFGTDTASVASSVVIGGLTAVLAIVAHFQGERQGRLSWEVHAWEQARTRDLEARERADRDGRELREDSQAIEAVLMQTYGAGGADYRVRLMDANVSLGQLKLLAQQAGLRAPMDDLVKRACSLNRVFWAATNRAIRTNATRSLEAQGLIGEADMERRAREQEMEQAIDRISDEAYEAQQGAEHTERDRERERQLIDEYIDGARARGWLPPPAPPGVLIAE